MALETTARWTTDDDELDYLFSGYGCMATTAYVLQDHLMRCARQFEAAMQARHETAISGAMRWPWSQEALILSVRDVRVV